MRLDASHGTPHCQLVGSFGGDGPLAPLADPTAPVAATVAAVPNATRRVAVPYRFGPAVPLNCRQTIERREPPARAAASNSLSAYRRPIASAAVDGDMKQRRRIAVARRRGVDPGPGVADFDDALAVGNSRPVTDAAPQPIRLPQYKLEEERAAREVEWARRRVAGARLGNTQAAVDPVPPSIAGGGIAKTVRSFASTLPRDPSGQALGGEVVPDAINSGLFYVKKAPNARPTTFFLTGGGCGRVATNYPLEDRDYSRQLQQRLLKSSKAPSGRPRTYHAPSFDPEAFSKQDVAQPAPALGGKAHLRENPALAPAEIGEPCAYPAGGLVWPPPLERGGEFSYSKPTRVESLRGAASPKPVWDALREERSTTCVDTKLETHVGPFRQPGTIHCPFPVRGRRPQQLEAARPATAGAHELRRILRQSHALARDCMYVNAPLVNGLGASDTSYGQVFERKKPGRPRRRWVRPAKPPLVGVVYD